MADESTASKRPVDKVRVGNVTASIWKNTTASGDFYNTTFEVSYKEGDTWKNGTSYGPSELLQLAKAADLVHTKVIALQAERSQAVSR